MAHAIKRMVLDLSHHNTVQSFEQMVAAGIVGIIHKASEGTGYRDDKYTGRRKGCAEFGLCWGAYHFATASDVDDQVANFLAAAQPDENTLLCLDWEPYGDNTMSLAQARDFIRQVEARTGRTNEVVLYSGNQAKEALGNQVDDYLAAHRLWLAQYGTNPEVQASWDEQGFWLWQYSDGQVGPGPHGCPGVTGYVDTNSFDGTPEQLRAEWATGLPQPAPEPAPPTDQVVVTITISAPGNVEVRVVSEVAK